MKTKKRMLAILLVLIMSISVLVACSKADEDSTTDDAESLADVDTADEAEEVVAEEDVIGEVTYIGESYFSLNTYEAESEVTDYASLDTATLSEVGNMDYVYTYETATYYKVVSGTLETVTAEDMEVGDLIAATTDADGLQSIIILKAAETEISEEETEATVESVVVAQLTAFNEDGTLSLTHYALSEEAVDYEITDFADVQMGNYIATETTEDYTIPEECFIYLIEDGVATEVDETYMIVTDMLVICTDEDGEIDIFVYPAEIE